MLLIKTKTFTFFFCIKLQTNCIILKNRIDLSSYNPCQIILLGQFFEMLICLLF